MIFYRIPYVNFTFIKESISRITCVIFIVICVIFIVICVSFVL